MSKRRRKKKYQHPQTKVAASPALGCEALYTRACCCAENGQVDEARRIYGLLENDLPDPRLKALVLNDQAVLFALAGDYSAARQRFRTALAIDFQCESARANLTLLEEDGAGHTAVVNESTPSQTVLSSADQGSPVKVAIVSFLFNWPSTGGGIVHTVELAQFLGMTGYEVQHFYARYDPWSIGRVEKPPPFPSEALSFDEASWTLPAIQARFREAVDRCAPDYVIITDSWNIKPRLAEALRGHRIILRLQAMECLCPLNNVRLLPDPGGHFRQCPRHQLATPNDCVTCVRQRGHLSGSLHQAERALAGVGTADYHECLLRALRDADVVLVVNPLTEALVSPYARSVRVVTAGMDPARFPWPWPNDPAQQSTKKLLTIFFAGLVEEWMKGFRVLHEACASLWQQRKDFELVATGDPPGQGDAFTRFVGWLSQEDLPHHLRAADMLVMPTIAQEALGRTAVEAMAVGRPVIASRIGGLPATVADGATGLLVEPGDAADLARKIEMLLDDPALRERLGQAGRHRFEEHYAWPIIIERHYRPLLQRIDAGTIQARRQG